MSTTIDARIESYDVQPNDLIRPSALFRMFQKSAGDDLDQRGLTYDRLREHGIVFVLSKMTVTFFRDIRSYDQVAIKTFPRGCKGVAFHRDFDVLVDGMRAAYANSSWAIIDVNDRKLLRPGAIEVVGTIPVELDDVYPIEDKRIRFQTSEMNRTDVREVYYAQIDRNGHMNNTFYPDIVYDYLPEAMRQTDVGKTMTIYYSGEILCGEKMDIYTAQTDSEFRFLAKNPATGRDVFSALLQISH